MTDCLLIGFNDSNFENYVQMVKTMGPDSGAYRDLELAFIRFDGKPYRSMDILNHFHFQHKTGAQHLFHNADFLWPVITCLGSYLTKRNLSFDYVSFPHLEQDKLREKLVKNDILTIAITTTLYVSPHPILEIISFIKKYNRTAKIIVGGPFISNQPKMLDDENMMGLFRSIAADIFVTCQEGEFALAGIIDALKSGASLDGVDNIVYRRGDDYVTTKTSIESNPLEENMVRYDLFSGEEFGEFVSLRTAKSCPFSCAFCGFPQRAGKYKYLSVEHVEQELDAIRNIGSVTTLSFIDDTFNVPKERFKELLRMMIRNDYGFKWNSFYRSDHGDEETIELMGKAGCEGIFLGIESGSDSMLKRMNKTAKRKDYLKAIPLLRDAGIASYASLIVGYPGETYETVQETIDLVLESRPDFYRAQLWYCDPITPIWEQKEKYGIKGSAFNWSHDTMDAATACDIIDRMFLAVPEEKSVWLPQFGFEFWSLFYLQRKGMTYEQLKTFLISFNAVIKEKLIYGDRKETSPALLKSLETSCRFDEPLTPDMRPVEVFSGGNYLAAEKFWTREFAGESVVSNLAAPRQSDDTGAATDDGAHWNTLPASIDKSLLGRLKSQRFGSLPETFLAAYSILLSRLHGSAASNVIASFERGADAGVVPLRMSAAADATFDAYVQNTVQSIGRAFEHREFAFHILTNPIRMNQHGSRPPAFDVGYIYRESGAEPTAAAVGFEEMLDIYAPLRREMGLILRVERDGEEIRTNFSYRPDRFREETVDALNSYLTLILEEITEHTGILLRDIGKQSDDGESSPVMESYAEEAFNF